MRVADGRNYWHDGAVTSLTLRLSPYRVQTRETNSGMRQETGLEGEGDRETRRGTEKRDRTHRLQADISSIISLYTKMSDKTRLLFMRLGVIGKWKGYNHSQQAHSSTQTLFDTREKLLLLLSGMRLRTDDDPTTNTRWLPQLLRSMRNRRCFMRLRLCRRIHIKGHWFLNSV